MLISSLGVLDWLPALDHPDLLAPAVRAALDDAPADLAGQCFVAAIDAALADTAAFCDAYHVPAAASANCVVVSGRRGKTTTTAACLVLATDRADVNKAVRKRLDVRTLSFAPTAEAVSATGMEYGGITPIGLPEAWPVLVDDAVTATAWVVIGSGIRGSKIALPGAMAAQLPHAEVMTLRQVSAPG